MCVYTCNSATESHFRSPNCVHHWHGALVLLKKNYEKHKEEEDKDGLDDSQPPHLPHFRTRRTSSSACNSTNLYRHWRLSLLGWLSIAFLCQACHSQILTTVLRHARLSLRSWLSAALLCHWREAIWASGGCGLCATLVGTGYQMERWRGDCAISRSHSSSLESIIESFLPMDIFSLGLRANTSMFFS